MTKADIRHDLLSALAGIKAVGQMLARKPEDRVAQKKLVDRLNERLNDYEVLVKKALED